MKIILNEGKFLTLSQLLAEESAKFAKRRLLNEFWKVKNIELDSHQIKVKTFRLKLKYNKSYDNLEILNKTFSMYNARQSLSILYDTTSTEVKISFDLSPAFSDYSDEIEYKKSRNVTFLKDIFKKKPLVYKFDIDNFVGIDLIVMALRTDIIGVEFYFPGIYKMSFSVESTNGRGFIIGPDTPLASFRFTSYIENYKGTYSANRMTLGEFHKKMEVLTSRDLK